MKTLIVTVVVLGLWAVDDRQADAGGFHFRTAGVHFDIGQPHGGYRYGGYGCGYGGGYGYSPRSYSGYRGYGYGHDHWHDTSHYDYHRGGYERHYNHYHYVPGHYDFHQEGHWDHH
jgi:hypothetical protein